MQTPDASDPLDLDAVHPLARLRKRKHFGAELRAATLDRIAALHTTFNATLALFLASGVGA